MDYGLLGSNAYCLVRRAIKWSWPDLYGFALPDNWFWSDFAFSVGTGEQVCAKCMVLTRARAPTGCWQGLNLQHLLDLWFSPKRFESETFYERFGVLFIKRYVPTGGDFFIRRYGIRIAQIRGSLESLIQFERFTRRLEAIHEIAFLGFVTFSLRRLILRHTTLLETTLQERIAESCQMGRHTFDSLPLATS
jgi:Glycosyl-4,4'-diaponeurosporenoate acyltransferase